MNAHASPGRETPYQLEVWTLDSADAVKNAGGLLVDRRMLGWETRVVAESVDGTSLQILGAGYRSLSRALEGPHRPYPSTLVTSERLYRTNPQILALVDDAITLGQSEVLLWGSLDRPQTQGCIPATIVEGRLSRAARAFKLHALAAAGLHSDVNDYESFKAVHSAWHLPVKCLSPVQSGSATPLAASSVVELG